MHGLFFGLTTPFTDDTQSIDEEALRRNMRHCAQLNANGIGWGGPLAEPYTLSIDERKRGHEILAEEAKRAGVCSYAYPVSDSVPVSLELARNAASAGCDLLMVNVPYEWTKTTRMVLEYFELVARAAGNAGIMVYDTPHSGLMLPIEILDQIADIENVCAMKPGFPMTATEAAALMGRLGDRVVLSAGTPDTWPEFAKAGYALLPPTSAAYMMQTTQWQPIREVMALCSEGRYREATLLSETIGPLKKSWQRVYATYFDRELGREQHPVAGIKRWVELIGMVGGDVRPPTSPAAPGEFDWMRDELDEHRRAGLLRIDHLESRDRSGAGIEAPGPLVVP
jgi:4-hydroxy-tetrahydrodipicolinate synthase